MSFVLHSQFVERTRHVNMVANVGIAVANVGIAVVVVVVVVVVL